MASETHVFMNQASICLGVILLIILLTCEIPEPYGKIWVWLIPAMLLANYFSLIWLSDKKNIPSNISD